jgi:hypothetical protein
VAILLSVLAFAFAVVACAAAVRTQRTVHRLAKALAREWGLRTGQGAGPAPREKDTAALAEREEWLKRSVEALEQRLREVLSRTAGLEAPRAAGDRAREPARRTEPGEEPRERVRRHLEALGYEEVAVLPGPGRGGALTFEARRDGMPAKGTARPGEDGRVEVRWAAPHRVFP